MKHSAETEEGMKTKRKGDSLKINEKKRRTKNGKRTTAQTSIPRFQEKKKLSLILHSDLQTMCWFTI